VTPGVKGAPALVTDRLELWIPRADDEAQMHAIVSDPQTGRHLGPVSRADSATRFQRNAGSWFLHGYGVFMLRLAGRPEVIGNCGVFHSYRGLGPDFDDLPEAGWILAADQVSKGLASEAMHAALAWFDREHGPRRIVCMIDPANLRSAALATKLGFAPTRLATMPGTGEALQLYARPADCPAGSHPPITRQG
jgi:RimJ/RimL family protein N-acetyltransferase